MCKHRQKNIEKSPLETVAITGALEMKQKDIVNESGPAASSTMSEDGRTAMSRSVKVVPPFCYSYNIHLGNPSYGAQAWRRKLSE